MNICKFVPIIVGSIVSVQCIKILFTIRIRKSVRPPTESIKVSDEQVDFVVYNIGVVSRVLCNV